MRELAGYREAAGMIVGIDVKDPEIEDKIACIVKKYGHSCKRDSYSKIYMELKCLPRKLRYFKKAVKYLAEDFVKSKILTHEEFSKRPHSRMIYGLFDWKKPKISQK